ncbi:DUF2339 domain-containing protein [Vandammella animalimorsus]|uniref:DUF2339 domain-containing protein n=1 Tax=Vandammella animalimorsus TaxID=2029117 RepID=A0A2A2AIX7_9BURK|nr:DUF2339 domain-containing protein [Vandammella animalimorsus]PAT37662.1 hypothetical protein CK625_05165 [Vandammella animalimorsus]
MDPWIELFFGGLLMALPLVLLFIGLSLHRLRRQVRALEQRSQQQQRQIQQLQQSLAAGAGPVAAAPVATREPATATVTVAAPMAHAAAPPAASATAQQAGDEQQGSLAAQARLWAAAVAREPSPPAAAPLGQASADAAPLRDAQAEEALWSDLPPRHRREHSQPPGGTATGGVMAWLRHWFSTGNVPVKVGMLVLFAGVAALLRYAHEQQWVQLPMWARLLGVQAAAVAGLWFGWRQRQARRGFALSVQGGALGILLLTWFAAYRLYGLLPAGAALAGTLATLALTVWLALRQDALALAMFGVLGGFLAPLWLGSGGGHVALFSYYAALNAAIFAICLGRAWQPLQLLGLGFTFGFFGLWLRAQPWPLPHQASAQAFLALFFALYLLLPAWSAWRGHGPAQQRWRWIDAVLVYGAPLAALALQAVLLEGQRRPLAAVALAASLLYGALAYGLRHQARLRPLVRDWAVLGAGFAALTVPLAFSAQATSVAWASLALALLWQGLRQRQPLLQGLGLTLHVLAWLVLQQARNGGIGNGQATAVVQPAWPVLNPWFATTAFLALTLLAAAWCLARWRQRPLHDRWALGLLILGVLELLGAGLREIALHSSGAAAEAWRLMLLALLGCAAAAVYRWSLPLPVLARTALLLGLAGPMLHWLLDPGHWYHPHSLWMALALAMYLASSRAVLHWLGPARPARMGEPAQGRAVRAWHAQANTAWWLHALLAATLWLWQACEDWLGPDAALLQGWALPLLAAPALGLALLQMRAPQWLGYGAAPEALAVSAAPARAAAAPGAASDAARHWPRVLARCTLWALGLVALPGLLLPGRPAPLPWLPVLNPQDLALLASLGLALRLWWPLQGAKTAPPWPWLAGQGSGQPYGLAALLALLWLSKSALAAVHHWAGVPWALPALLHSALAQTVLTLLWGALAVAAWVQGSRRRSRPLWTLGLLVMGAVLLKLVLLDRQHLGNLWGIASFMGYGLLCVVVGYLAPAPPRERASAANEEAADA